MFWLLLCALTAIRSQASLASQQTAQVLQSETTHAFRISYLLFLPADYEKDLRAQWPLILYVHGGSLRGTDIEQVHTLGLPHKLESDPDFPFIVVFLSPCQSSMNSLIKLLSGWNLREALLIFCHPHPMDLIWTRRVFAVVML